jgi:hypothetical protein
VLTQGISQDQCLGLASIVCPLDFDVIDILAHGQRHIAGQRPGRGRPDQEVGIGLILDFEADED